VHKRQARDGGNVFTLDYSTDVGKVRALIGDTDVSLPFLQDEDITVFLDLEASSLYGAASVALLTMATKHTVILKKIDTLDLKTDGPAVAESLRKLANDMREKADDEPAFDFATMITPPFQWAATVWGLPTEAVEWSEDWSGR
jgi:hypothetical protein